MINKEDNAFFHYMMSSLLFVILFLFILPASVQSEIKVLQADMGFSPEGNDITNLCSLGCAMGWKVKASSHLSLQGKNKHDVTKLGDGLVNTAWAAGGRRFGIGESITFRFTREDFDKAKIGDRINFNGFMVINGYAKNKKIWQENSRVKKFRIYVNSNSLYDVMLHDSMTVQEVAFDSIWLKPGDTVKIFILEIYHGTKHRTTAISELVPLGAH